MPEIAGRYHRTAEKAIIGKWFTGLFVLESLLTEPALFDTYRAFILSL